MDDARLEALLVDYARSHLSPTAEERDFVTKAYDTLQEYLQGRTFQSGSYARHTSTTPVNDLDVFYVIPDEVLKEVRAARELVDPAKLDIHRILSTLAAELQKSYGTEATVRAQPHSVGIFFGSDDDFSIDVVPAVPIANGTFWVPEIAQLSVAHRREAYRTWPAVREISWIRSHPKGYIAQASTVDERTAGRFRKSTKILKKWRWHAKCANEHFRFKSFHLELLVTERFQRAPTATCLTVVRGIVARLQSFIADPTIRDLADNQRFVDHYVTTLTDEERATVLAQFRMAQERWAQVEGAETLESARAALERFLGVTEEERELARIQTTASGIGVEPPGGRDPGEEFLSDDGIPIRPRYRLKVDATVTMNGFRPFALLGYRKPLFKLRGLDFRVVSCDVPEPFDVKWKIKNRGTEATRKGKLRGEIVDDRGKRTRHESTLYLGRHYVECYAIKNGVCVALDRIEVPIGSE